MGVSEFYYSIYPYENNAQAEKKAEELNFGLRYVIGCFHDGDLPEEKYCIDMEDENIIISAVKEREDENENIIRFFEVNGENVDVKLKLFDKTIKTKVLHNGLKTITEENEEVNLIEW